MHRSGFEPTTFRFTKQAAISRSLTNTPQCHNTVLQVTCLYKHRCIAKAGQLVGLADCYAVIVLADNATFLLAVNRIAAFRSDSAIITHLTQLVEHQPLNLEVAGSSPTWDKIFPHVCAHFGIHGRCGIVLPRLRLRGQLQNRTALCIVSRL